MPAKAPGHDEFGDPVLGRGKVRLDPGDGEIGVDAQQVDQPLEPGLGALAGQQRRRELLAFAASISSAGCSPNQSA